MPRFLCIICATIALIGCGTSKWAMDDPDYHAKYDKPYAPGKKIPRMLKQAIDARHLNDKGGTSVGFAGANDPVHAGAELGRFNYAQPWLESRIALAGLISEPADGAFGGVNSGIRVQTPSRIAPFAGVGVFAGYSQRDVINDRDGKDNNGNLVVDEKGELDKQSFGFVSFYPETGMHWWLSSRCRLSGSVSYHVSTEGRNADFVFYGISLSFLDEPNPTPVYEPDSLAEDSSRIESLEDDPLAPSTELAERFGQLKTEGETVLSELKQTSAEESKESTDAQLE